jgi:serine/threonine protein kinase
MAKSVELLHSHDLAHLDIHEQNYLVSKNQNTDIYQATLIDFDRMVSSQEPRLEQKLLDIANEQIESLYGWYKDPQDRYAFEFNLARLPPEVVHFSNVQKYRFSSSQGPAILLKVQRRILTDFLVNANLITDLQADKIESAWKKLEALSLPLTMQEEREFVFAMDIFALGSLWLKIMCKTNGLLTGLSVQNRNKLLSFIITKMLHPDPVLRATIDECVEMINLFVSA